MKLWALCTGMSEVTFFPLTFYKWQLKQEFSIVESDQQKTTVELCSPTLQAIPQAQQIDEKTRKHQETDESAAFRPLGMMCEGEEGGGGEF